jgi:hypothetical protein
VRELRIRGSLFRDCDGKDKLRRAAALNPDAVAFGYVAGGMVCGCLSRDQPNRRGSAKLRSMAKFFVPRAPRTPPIYSVPSFGLGNANEPSCFSEDRIYAS